jgi:drug/metabolite transporter (DMT)-like permease
MPALLALSSSLLWGTADFFGGVLSRRMPAMVVVLVTQALALLMLLAVATVSATWSWTPSQVWWGIGAGMVGPVGLIAFYRGLATGRMGVVSPIAATGVAVPVLVGLAQGDRPTTSQVAGLVLAIVGVVLVGGPDVRSDALGSRSPGGQWRPVALAVVAALGFGGAFVFLDGGAQASPGSGIVVLLVVQRATSVVLLVVPVLVLVGLASLRRRSLPALVGVGVADVGANGLYALSSTFGLLSVTAALGSMYPVMTLFLARTLLHERLSRLQGYGVATALAGVVLLAMGPS